MKKTLIFSLASICIIAAAFMFSTGKAGDSATDATGTKVTMSQTLLLNNSYCRADLNGDGTVNNTDLLLFLGCYPCAYKTTVNCPDCVCADFNQDGQINWWDLQFMQNAIIAGPTGCNNPCTL